MRCASNNGHVPSRQRGYVLLLVLLILLVGGTSVYLAARDPGTASRATESSEQARLLEEAREAVIAYAGFGGSNGRPGALPCPDYDNDGTVDGNCLNSSAPVHVERFPWRTLELTPTHAKYWYVMDGDFRNHPDAEPINVELEGSLSFTVGSSGEEMTGFAALIIAPGDPLAGQTGRDSGSESIDDYLEGENADGDEAFVDCNDVEDCNDRIVGIRVDPLFRAVQHRVLGELEKLLKDFYQEDDRNFLPYAAPFGDSACEEGLLEGRIATEAGDCETPPGPYNKTLREADFTSNEKTEWIWENEWLDHVVYRVAEECTEGESECVGADLQLKSDSGLSGVLAAAGTPLAGQNRSVSPDIDDFLESDENTDGDQAFDDAPLSGSDNDILRGFVM